MQFVQYNIGNICNVLAAILLALSQQHRGFHGDGSLARCDLNLLVAEFVWFVLGTWSVIGGGTEGYASFGKGPSSSHLDQ